ncbi:MAG: hypothetical protein M3Q03_20595, partial [Chloroflexota bacterium]|nr:hypothetical protein [Chloroflexota bacterium]
RANRASDPEGSEAIDWFRVVNHCSRARPVGGHQIRHGWLPAEAEAQGGQDIGCYLGRWIGVRMPLGCHARDVMGPTPSRRPR